jgi:hypothetical protein
VPSASPAGGSYPSPISVTLSPGITGDLVKYTTDGTDPSLGGLNATAPIAIADTTTLKFVEVFAGGTVSPVVTEAYTIDGVKPVVLLDNPVPGYYHTVQQVSLRADKPADVFYNLSTTSTPADPLGADGKLSGTKYDGKPISVGSDTTFALRAVDPAGNVSDLTVATWHVKPVTQLGPIDPATGYPTWYVDSNGLQLQLCVDATGNCLTSVADPSLPASVPNNFIDEGFYWDATATMPVGNGGKATLTLATEAAFGGTGAIRAGQQIAFNRIRMRITNLTPGATYKITHPYGVETATADDGGLIFVTDDNGCLDPGTGCLATTVLGGRLGPWLTPVTPGPAGYIGDAATPTLVTGSPAGTNFFLLEGPNAGGAGIDRAETNLFVVAGKLSSTVTPLAAPTAPAAPSDLTATASNGQVDLTWTAPALGASSYNVKRGTTAGGPYPDVTTGVTGTKFTDSTVTNGTQYFYVVTAVNATGESDVSNEATATPQVPVAAPVVSFSPTSLSFGQTKGGQKVGTPSAPAVVTLTNSGNAPLNITNVSLGGASSNAFAISTNACVGTIAAGAQCSISVTFTPTVKGNVTASLVVDTQELGKQTVSLLGKGN